MTPLVSQLKTFGFPAESAEVRSTVDADAYVLLVEDQLDNQYLVSEYLEWKGYRVRVARDGEEGLAIAKEEPPGIILMDMTMPKMDGFEATRRARAIAGLEKVPIIALTARAMKDDMRRCSEAGCTAFLAKPFEPEDLLLAVERYLGRSPGITLP